MNRLKSALDNLVLKATNNNAVLEQLTAVNLALTSTSVMLRATNKQLADKAAAAPKGSAAPKVSKHPQPGNYCWTHGHRCSKEHMSITCGNRAPGHKDKATFANTLGG
jgi:hypothetical protein